MQSYTMVTCLTATATSMLYYVMGLVLTLLHVKFSRETAPVRFEVMVVCMDFTIEG
jgi:hypothetical protein